ncbi:hypothetical protein DFH29DRAFT_910688 [Suillus ampliporus]|nr:hypothetical protein DFH29DRAFT_910688 [Suillus ampliporus]
MMEAESSTAVVRIVNEDAFHTFFSSPDADVILGANDHTLFRVHSWTLKTTSGWFRSLFSMPSTEPQKYDMPGPVSLIRILVMTPPLLDQPLRLYAAATRFGWEEEAKYASAQSLTLNIYAPEYQATLRKLCTRAVLDLINLHRNRREGIRNRLNEQPFVTGSTVASCPRCRWKIDHHTWRELKYKVVMEMDVRPLGDTVVDVGLIAWPEANACWDAKCPNTECTCVLYDKSETLRLIRECIDSLPKTT